MIEKTDSDVAQRASHRTLAMCRTGALPWLLAMTCTLAACNQPPAVNVLRDDSIERNKWSTPSQDEVLAMQKPPVARERGFNSIHGPRAKAGVPHYPLWWEDPFEDKGDMDGQFAITWQDGVAVPYSLGRFLLNTMAWPVSAVVTLPGTSMVSDGLIGRDHDASPGTSPDPTATIADFAGIDTAPTQETIE